MHKLLLRGAPVVRALHQARLLSLLEPGDTLSALQGQGDWTWSLYLLSGYPELVLR